MAEATEADANAAGETDSTGASAAAGNGKTGRGARKVREGIVASTGMDKTAVVEITTRKPHPLYKKTMVRTSRLYTHDESNELRVGDRVRVAETRPLSKTKRWRLVEILERAK
jgi:small subunit ribosomal protein S17